MVDMEERRKEGEQHGEGNSRIMRNGVQRRGRRERISRKGKEKGRRN